MPNNLTAAEIKKALECCLNDSCYTSECSFFEETKDGEHCQRVAIKHALDLINRKDQENESLKAAIERLREIRDLCNTTILEKNEQIEKLEISDASKEECTIKQHGEIKELKAEVERLITLNSKLEGENYSLRVKQRTIKAEAYKEFANRLTDKIMDNIDRSLDNPNGNDYVITDVYETINNLLNGLVGDGDGK